VNASKIEDDMNVRVPAHTGFCFGVKRAIKISRDMKKMALQENPRSPFAIYTLGPLVHNPLVTEELREEGIIPLDSLRKKEKAYLIIRSHGAPPEILKEARMRGYRVVDATCPLVKKIHLIVERLRTEGYGVVVIGHRDHPEVKGIVGYAGDECTVIESKEELDRSPLRKKTGIVVQTTASVLQFSEIASGIVERCLECRVFNTLCFETLIRQRETEELARSVKLMIVVGGKESSNTRRLVEICAAMGTKTHLVETPRELRKSWFRGVNRVGITAGTSTPMEMLNQVSQWIEENKHGEKKNDGPRI
jgi:(E)-4-hydroxy-3-methyl-but-2-enyl pyrophosphate reductase